MIEEERELIDKKAKGMNMSELRSAIANSNGYEQQIFIKTLEGKLGKRLKIILEESLDRGVPYWYFDKVNNCYVKVSPDGEERYTEEDFDALDD